MQFITVTVTGTAPRSFFSEAPGPDTITTMIGNALASDGFQAPVINVTASQTGLFSGDNPYSATITVQAGDTADPNQVASAVANDVGVAVGQPPTSFLLQGTSTTPPTASQSANLGTGGSGGVASSVGGWWTSILNSLQPLASALNTDVQLVVVGLVALLALAVIVLAPELKANLEG